MKIDEVKLTAYLAGEPIESELKKRIEDAILEDDEIGREAQELRELIDDVESAFATERPADLPMPEFNHYPDQPKLVPDTFNILHILPWISGIAAAILLGLGIIYLSRETPYATSNQETVQVQQPQLQNVDSQTTSQFRDLVGSSLTWSQSQVLADSVFLPDDEALLSLSVPAKTGILPSSMPGSTGDRPFSKTWSEPFSQVPLFYDGLALTRLELALNQGQLPEPSDVQVEALVNGFPYRQPVSSTKSSDAFSISMEQANSPWSAGNTLLRVGLQALEPTSGSQPRNNLVFLVDVSGSMDKANKLPLIRAGLKKLLDELRPMDRLAILTYGPASELLLDSTYVFDRNNILAAISRLEPVSSEKEQNSLQLAYDIAHKHFMEEGYNRIVVCTDGDLSLGNVLPGELRRLVREQAEKGVSLSVYGFGTDSQKERRLERLAALGQGSVGFVNSPLDVVKDFSGRLSGLFTPVAMDVKMELEFNPEKVDSYRLIGFEESEEDSSTIDSPVKREVFAGHSLTALYELIPNEFARDPKADAADGISPPLEAAEETAPQELVTVRVQYLPEGRTQEEMIEAFFNEDATPFGEATSDTRFAAAVTGFGQILRNSPYKGDIDYDWVLQTAANSLGNDEGGKRTRFLELVRQAEAIRNSESAGRRK
ncbi:MAG: von Willebrand factor type A domain-containing protein [Verrucomicrobiae bacterium]|nr:von Willebrand factor type A domain-containing protein [Verrucomicrobiae bacterium]